MSDRHGRSSDQKNVFDADAFSVEVDPEEVKPGGSRAGESNLYQLLEGF